MVCLRAKQKPKYHHFFRFWFVFTGTYWTIRLCHCPRIISNQQAGPQSCMYYGLNKWLHLTPIYTTKYRCDMRCDKLCDRENPCRKLSQAVASCHKLSQAVATAHCKSWARFNFCDRMHCDMGRDMHCNMGNPGRKLGVGLSCVFSTSCTGLAAK